MARAGVEREMDIDPWEVARRPGFIMATDNSNMWIPGKETAGKFQGLDGEDPSWRVHLGNMARHVQSFEARPMACMGVFGSIPPPTDSLWERYMQNNIFVKTTRRSQWNSKEKRVDTSIAAFLAFQAALVPVSAATAGQTPEDFRSFILVSGDSDYKDTIAMILQLGIQVTLWSWTQAEAAVSAASLALLL